MFSALLKAFTGRAGLLAGLLALALVVVTAAAVYLKTPALEQKLAESALPVLQSTLADGDELSSFRAEGRNLMLEGRFGDPQGLVSQLKTVEGVRHVFVNGADLSAGVAEQAPASDEPQLVQEESTPEQAPVQTDESTSAETESLQVAAETAEPVEDTTVESPSTEVGSTELAATVEEPAAETESTLDVSDESAEGAAEEVQPVAEAQETETAPAESVVEEPVADELIEESSLSLRYDGTRLQLSGHMGDEQMAQLVVESVRRAVPSYSELEADVDSKGKPSPLNWMREFLAVVSRLPGDAQGVIVGSDSKGVEIIPDADQTLVAQEDAVTELEQEEAAEAQADPETQAPAVEDATQAAADEIATVEDAPAAEAGDDAAAMAEATVEPSQEIALADETVDSTAAVHPGQYIVTLNKRLAATPVFSAGDFTVGESLAAELDSLADVMRQHPDLLLRIVGNVDFKADPRFADFIGLDRARAARDYLYQQGIERRRVFARPLPKDYAFNKQVQLVFYISE